ncbi:MAG: hypothetical protein JXA22_06105 [Candidatus Thermoplasmatota archaeon]|nr:hypothetical protein [Candidatus Thermoplasmatota archaeon]
MVLPEDDRQHKKRLKEADRVYKKFFKAFQQGKVTKEELREKLRPYKFELKELGYPVKIRDDEKPPQQPSDEKKEEARTTPASRVTYRPWSKRSSLTIEEIEKRIDHRSLETSTSEPLRSLYRSMYGEELPPPEDFVPIEDHRKELPAAGSGKTLPPHSDEEEGTVAGEKRSFWRSLMKGQKEKEKEST